MVKLSGMWKFCLIVIVSFYAAACTKVSSAETPQLTDAEPAAIETAEAVESVVETPMPIAEPIPLPAPETEPAPVAAERIPARFAPYCDGVLKQGGLVICHGAPGTEFKVAGKRATADETGTVQIGLTRDAPDVIGWSAGDGSFGDLTIAPREDPFRKIEGLDCDKVDARTEEQKAHAGRSWTKKVEGFASFNAGRGALDGFILPSEGRTSSPFGPTRKYVGVSAVTGEPCDKTSVHRGYDIAAPTGTPVKAPADGTVTLADPDLYYEGGTIFLDHGHGLLSVFMHLSSVDVSAGDVIQQGDLIGKIGSTGRSTGPHLHWGIKWRDQLTDNRKGDFYIDPELLLDMPISE